MQSDNNVANVGEVLMDLIATKTRPPQILKNRLARTELMQRLKQSAIETGLVTIVAPAGAGKSTILVELHSTLQSDGYECFWLSLEPADNSPSIHARYITSTLIELDKSFTEKELKYLKAHPPTDLNNFFSALVRMIASKHSHFAIFIDDFQVIDHPDIIFFWNRLITYAPENMCLVFASRGKIPLDLGRKRLSGSLFELDQVDLNLNPEQITQFMREIHSIDLLTESAQLLHDSTEGWITGLQLAGMTIKKSNGEQIEILKSFSARNRVLKEYLFEAVYKLQAEEIRDFLLRTSPLTRISSSLCDAVTGYQGSARIIGQIEDLNLFLIPLDQEKKWYRYHHFFSEFLLNELKQSGSFDHHEICTQAAVWCQTQGYLTEAIQYCLDAADYDKAVDLLAQHAFTIAIDEGDHATILDWMGKLPHKQHYRRPEILLIEAFSRAFAPNSVTLSLSLCDEVERLLKETENPLWQLSGLEIRHFLLLAQVTRLIAMACADETHACIEAADRLLGTELNGDPVLVASAITIKAHCQYLVKSPTKAIRSATKAYTIGQRGDSPYLLVWADSLACLANIELGHITAADEYAERTLSCAGLPTRYNRHIAAIAALMKANIETQRCNFEAVERIMSEGNVLASVSNPPELQLNSMLIDARLQARNGALAAARSSLQRGQEIALAANHSRMFIALVTEEIDLQLRYEDKQAAMNTIRRTNILDPENPILRSKSCSRNMEHVRLIQARIFLEECKPKEAIRLLDMLQKSARTNDRIMSMQQLRSLKSIALWKSGNQTAAIRELDQAIGIAVDENHCYPLYSAGNALLEILEHTINNRSIRAPDDIQTNKRQFENRLAALLRGECPTDERENSIDRQNNPTTLANPLTNRELQILRLIATGISNKALADVLLITLPTVKWHVHNIFEKLGVSNRISATIYARENDLV